VPDLVAAALLALALTLALLRPGWLLRWERTLLRLLRRPRSRGRWALGLAVATLLAQGAAALLAGLPEPRIHDEHSLLLQADTFLHGRLANPTPPFWRHLETFHVLVHPTYAAKYPPAQGGVLALGWLLGHPLVGVWISGALLVAATTWMLHAWLRPPWARLGAVLVAGNVVVATQWSLGYRGTFVAAAGGALLFGATERLRERPTLGSGLMLGSGLVVLAASRPYEGLVMAVAALVPLAANARRRPVWGGAALRRAAPAAVLLLAGGLGWVGYYHWRVTGDPLRLPFQVYDERYARVPLFLWEDLRSPAPANPRVDAFFREFERDAWADQHSVGGWLLAARRKTAAIAHFYLRPALLPVLLALPWVLYRPRVRRAAWALLALLGSQLVILPSHPHYVAPGACLFAYLAVECWRRLRLWRPLGRALAAALPLAVLLAIPARVVDLRSQARGWPEHRAELQRRLQDLPGRHLVLVSYDPRSSPHSEWVYNGADVHTAPVLWARSLSPRQDCALVRALPARRAWSLEVVDDLTPPRLDPLPAGSCGERGPGLTARSPVTDRSALTGRSARASPRSASAR
jgi:hypothetical protein